MGNYCYYFPPGYQSYTFDQARRQCRDQSWLAWDAQLVSIHSAQEASFITTNIDDTSRNVWLGLRKEGASEWLNNVSHC